MDIPQRHPNPDLGPHPLNEGQSPAAARPAAETSATVSAADPFSRSKPWLATSTTRFSGSRRKSFGIAWSKQPQHRRRRACFHCLDSLKNPTRLNPILLQEHPHPLKQNDRVLRISELGYGFGRHESVETIDDRKQTRLLKRACIDRCQSKSDSRPSRASS